MANAQQDSPSGGQTSTTKWEYFGVGCFSMFIGFAGGGMIAVLVAKIAGGLQRCPADKDTGAPCSWLRYAVFGMVIGTILVPTITIWLFHRGRARANKLRG